MSAWTCRQFAVKAAEKIVPPHPRIPCWKGLSADSEEKREPVSGINAGVVVSLKVLDPKRPIREADTPGSDPRRQCLTQPRHCNRVLDHTAALKRGARTMEFHGQR